MEQIKALTFDVGGTVFDWKSAVRQEVEARAQTHGVEVDSDAFAMNWRKRMFEILREVRSGALPRFNADEIHRRVLDELSTKYPSLALSAQEMDEMNKVWHRMPVWADPIRPHCSTAPRHYAWRLVRHRDMPEPVL